MWKGCRAQPFAKGSHASHPTSSFPPLIRPSRCLLRPRPRDAGRRTGGGRGRCYAVHRLAFATCCARPAACHPTATPLCFFALAAATLRATGVASARLRQWRRRRRRDTRRERAEEQACAADLRLRVCGVVGCGWGAYLAIPSDLNEALVPGPPPG